MPSAANEVRVPKHTTHISSDLFRVFSTFARFIEQIHSRKTSRKTDTPLIYNYPEFLCQSQAAMPASAEYKMANCIDVEMYALRRSM